MRAARPLLCAVQQQGPESLEGSVAWVVGGVGVIGRGICRGLLRAGATVIASSKFPETLVKIQEDLQHPKGLITVNGTMMAQGDASPVARAMELPELQGRRIEHVVAHSGVRWWAEGGDAFETATATMQHSRDVSLFAMGVSQFTNYATLLPALHFSAAQQLLPHLQKLPAATYTFVNGGLGIQRSAIDQVNIFGMWGLAAAMREEFRGSHIRVEELRVTLEFDRLAHEKEREPRPTPLSHDIGDICAGMSINAMSWKPNKVFQAVDSYDHILMLKTRYPCPVLENVDVVQKKK